MLNQIRMCAIESNTTKVIQEVGQIDNISLTISHSSVIINLPQHLENISELQPATCSISIGRTLLCPVGQ